MAERRLLTDRTLQALKAAKSGTRYEIMDANIQSLGVRVYDKADKKGRATHRTFFLLSRFPGSANPTRRALGTYADAPAPPDTLSLDQARQKAGNWIDLISKGTDPRDDEQRIKDEAAAAKAEDNRARAAKIKNSFATVAETYIADRADKRRASSDAQEIRRMLVGEWDATPIADITPRNVRDLIDRIKVRAPYDARNAWTHLTGIFKWAVHDDLIAASPLASLDKKLIFRNVKIAPRQRSLSDDEIFAYWRAAGRLSYPAGPFYKLLLLTGVRLNELADASWSEFHPELRRLLRQRKPVDWSTIDDKFKAWTVPPERFKSDAEHLVALSDEALRLIETLPTFAGCDFLFTVNGRSPVWIGDKYKKRLDARMLRTVKALARVRGDDPARVTLKHWVHHDLRRVVRTGLSALKVEDHVAEIVIGHGRKGIQRTYDVHKYADEARDALVAWAERVRGVRHRLNYVSHPGR